MSASSEDLPLLPSLAPRSPDSHKGDFGRVLIIAGSLEMGGAAALAGQAALRSGAGLVTVATSAACQPMVAGFEASYMTVPLPADDQGRISAAARPRLERLVERVDAVACGPGLGRSPQLTELVGWLFRTLPQPLVVDADGLNALAELMGGVGGEAAADELSRSRAEHAGPRVLTPHPGEFGRLLRAEGLSPAELRERAPRFAAGHRLVLVLKGHQTLITDGHLQAVNTTGNPGLATGGTGDVLTGVLVALLGQGLDGFAAARLAAHVHGLAGDLAAQRLGQVGMIASDLPGFLPPAWSALASRPRHEPPP